MPDPRIQDKTKHTFMIYIKEKILMKNHIPLKFHKFYFLLLTLSESSEELEVEERII